MDMQGKVPHSMGVKMHGASCKISMNNKNAEKLRSEQFLKNELAEGSTVYTMVYRVARSGLSRRIHFYALAKDVPGLMRRLDYKIAKTLGKNLSDDGVKIEGVGLNYGLWAVEMLSQSLYGRIDALKQQSLW